jgi:hypothetical protein
MFTGSKHSYPPKNTVGRERENCGTQLNSNRYWRDALSSVQLVQLTIKSFSLRSLTACEAVQNIFNLDLRPIDDSAPSCFNSHRSRRVFDPAIPNTVGNTVLETQLILNVYRLKTQLDPQKHS